MRDSLGRLQRVVAIGAPTSAVATTLVHWARQRPGLVVGLVAPESTERAALVERLEAAGAALTVHDCPDRPHGHDGHAAELPGAVVEALSDGDDIDAVAFALPHVPLAEWDAAEASGDGLAALVSRVTGGSLAIGVAATQRLAQQGHGALVAFVPVPGQGEPPEPVAGPRAIAHAAVVQLIDWLGHQSSDAGVEVIAVHGDTEDPATIGESIDAALRGGLSSVGLPSASQRVTSVLRGLPVIRGWAHRQTTSAAANTSGAATIRAAPTTPTTSRQEFTS